MIKQPASPRPKFHAAAGVPADYLLKREAKGRQTKVDVALVADQADHLVQTIRRIPDVQEKTEIQPAEFR